MAKVNEDKKVYLTSYTIDGVKTKLAVWAKTEDEAAHELERSMAEDGIEIKAAELSFTELTQDEYKRLKP